MPTFDREKEFRAAEVCGGGCPSPPFLYAAFHALCRLPAATWARRRVRDVRARQLISPINAPDFAAACAVDFTDQDAQVWQRIAASP